MKLSKVLSFGGVLAGLLLVSYWSGYWRSDSNGSESLPVINAQALQAGIVTSPIQPEVSAVPRVSLIDSLRDAYINQWDF
jgi:hypothetical protein